ncbi:MULTISPECIES: ATP-grasp domain-containing protein [unclassified Kribbella]|uniref:ATP-grasp domain-containing protein n=1 Tax=unclassified Kribbella TaxID=2644121 RepID=UPI00301B3A84
MTKRIALATSAAHPELHEHDFPLVDALRATGLDPVAEVWTDPSVDWSAYDAVLLRSVWDYHVRYGEFTEWLSLVDKAGVPVFNDSGLVRWNGDKRYLVELRERGVAIVPSQIAAGACLREVVAGLDGQEIVIKPTVSASARHTVRGVAGSDELSRAMDDLPDTVYLVQPFVSEIVTEGEWSLMFIDGEFTHAVVKRPAAGDYRVQMMFGGEATVTEPTPAVLERAQAALAEAGRAPLYARVDGVVVNGRFLLMELELIEPYLFLPEFPEANEKLAAAVAKRL